MALDITFSSGNSVCWHIGQKHPVKYDNHQSIIEIQADGDELEYIRNLFTQRIGAGYILTILVPQQQVVRWFGDIAKTIVANL